jgi:hypothetical protein
MNILFEEQGKKFKTSFLKELENNIKILKNLFDEVFVNNEGVCYSLESKLNSGRVYCKSSINKLFEIKENQLLKLNLKAISECLKAGKSKIIGFSADDELVFRTTEMDYEVVSGNFERLYIESLASVLQENLEAVGGVKYDEREMQFAKEMLKASGIEDVSVLEKPAAVLPLGCDYPTLKGVSSDVGNVTWVAPTASFRGATFVPAGLGHCWQFTSSGGTTIGTKGVMNVAKVLFFTAYDLYCSPETVEAVKNEFEIKRGKDFVFIPLIGDRNPPLDYRK